MITEALSTVRVQRLRERRSRGVAMVAEVEGGVALLVSNGLLKEHQTRDRKAVGRVSRRLSNGPWSAHHGWRQSFAATASISTNHSGKAKADTTIAVDAGWILPRCLLRPAT